MSSLFGSMGGAAANAMEGYAIGQAIGGANARANHSANQAQLWYEQSEKLEALIVSLRKRLKDSEDGRDEFAEQLRVAEKNLSDEKASAGLTEFKEGIKLTANTVYGRKISWRLAQMEKALQHSSADKAAVNVILNVYKDIFGDFSTLVSNGTIPPDAMKKAEEVWTNFMACGKLTESKPIQDLIDQAPMPIKTPNVLF
jgi:hypothetical protein